MLSYVLVTPGRNERNLIIAARVREVLVMRFPWISCLAASLAVSTQAMAAPSFTINYVDDASGTFASRGWLDADSLFQQNIRAAAGQWGNLFDTDETLVIRVDTTSFAARAGGGFSYGRFLYANANGKQVWEVGSLTRMLTGANPGETAFGYDIVLGFDEAFVQQHYWFDPQPLLRTAAVPANKGDFVSVVLHELGHGFGIAGNRDFASGQLLTTAISQFDDLSYFGGNGSPFNVQGQPNPLFFGGDQAAAVYGSDLPLTHKAVGDPNFGQNFYHLSACDPLAPDGLETTLMNGCVLPHGERLDITPYDRAVMGDLGYPMAELLAADFNEDGQVDASDLGRWTMAFGMSQDADADGDGDSDGADFLTWQRQLGGAANLVAVPESRSALSFLCSVAGLLVCTRRRASLIVAARSVRPLGQCREGFLYMANGLISP